MLKTYYDEGRKYYLYDDLVDEFYQVAQEPQNYVELLDDMGKIGYTIYNTNPIVKLRGFVNNYLIENVVAEKLGLSFVNPHHGRLYIENGYSYYDCVGGIEIKTAYTTRAAETMIDETSTWMKLDYNGRREYNNKLKRNTGHFVAIHGANTVVYAIPSENKIIKYDFVNETKHTYLDIDFGGLL